MGKISDALKKARHGEEKTPASPMEEEAQEDLVTPPPSQETQPPSPPSPPEVQQSPPPPKAQPPAEVPSPAQSTDTVKPYENGEWDERLYRAVNEDYYLPEVFRTLRSRILLPEEGRKVPKTIMVTSVAPREGKSFITANLGISLAQDMEQHSLLLSCDLRRPSLSSLFGMENNLGLVDYLRDNRDISELIRKTSVNKLSIIPSGKPPANPAELLSSAKMRLLVEELAERYDDRIIIFDSPPYQLASETAVLAKMVDGVIIVVRQGGAAKHQVKKIIEKIDPEHLLGVVFNGHTTNFLERALMKGYGSYSSQEAYRSQ